MRCSAGRRSGSICVREAGGERMRDWPAADMAGSKSEDGDEQRTTEQPPPLTPFPAASAEHLLHDRLSGNIQSLSLLPAGRPAGSDWHRAHCPPRRRRCSAGGPSAPEQDATPVARFSRGRRPSPDPSAAARRIQRSGGSQETAGPGT